ncbi:MAG: DUF2969 domain-containing protein [Enterococcus sp.]
MSKKNKDIEVRIEESQKTISGTTYEVTELFIGKKRIGEILAYGPKEFEIFMSEENIGSTKTLDAAVETVIRQWNLQD